MKKEQSINLSKTSAIIKKYGGGSELCIKILEELQASYGYLPVEALEYITKHTAISKRQIYGVATFYKRFRFKPMGAHLIRLCHGTACHVNGAEGITTAIENVLKIKNQETTRDGLFTLETVACLGCCSLAPVMMIDSVVYGRLTPDKVRRILKQYQNKAH